MQNENIATWKSATWNSFIYEKDTKWKSYNMKKVQLGKSQTQKSEIWKWCSMNKLQHKKVPYEESATWKKHKMPEWYMEKEHKNIAL